MHTELVAVFGTVFLCFLFFVAGVIYGKTKALDEERLVLKKKFEKEVKDYKKKIDNKRNNWR
jgi:hypothetical protein